MAASGKLVQEWKPTAKARGHDVRGPGKNSLLGAHRHMYVGRRVTRFTSPFIVKTRTSRDGHDRHGANTARLPTYQAKTDGIGRNAKSQM